MRLLLSALILLPLVLPIGNAFATPTEAPATDNSDQKSASTDVASLHPSVLALEPFFALQSRSVQGTGELIGIALRIDTTTPERFRGWYLRLEGMDRVPGHGSSGDPALHAEGGFLFRPRLQSGAFGVGITLSAGPALGWINEQAYWECDPQPCLRIPVTNQVAVGAAVDAAVDLHVDFVTLSFRARWRTTVGTMGVHNTRFIGPGLGVNW